MGQALGSKPGAKWGSLWLLLGISASWVSVAQLARAAEERSEEQQRCSVVPLMTWANATAWLLLAVPYANRRAQSRASQWPSWELLETDAFHALQPARFVAIALSTNFCYISALHYLPASLNTAIFSTSPVMTLLLSALFLRDTRGDQDVRRDAGGCGGAVSVVCTQQALQVALSLGGVLLVAEPWCADAATATSSASTSAAAPPRPADHLSSGARSGTDLVRFSGAGLSLLAALGTATYQVYFKATFGDRMQPEEVGLFLAHMGAYASLFCAAGCLGAHATGLYPVALQLVPWDLIVATALSSAVFNFLIKFGLSRDTPVVVSLATQVGIPINVLLDVVVVHARIQVVQAVGVLLVLSSLAIQRRPASPPPLLGAPGANARLLGDGKDAAGPGS